MKQSGVGPELGDEARRLPCRSLGVGRLLHRAEERLRRKVDFLFDQLRGALSTGGCARVRRVAIVRRNQHWRAARCPTCGWSKTPVEAAVSAANEEMQATRLPLQSKQEAATP